MDQKEYWNGAVGRNKEFTTPFQLEVFSKYVGQNAMILDVGCGYGRTLDFLWRNGYSHLLGIDFSEALIERGHRLFPDLDLRVMKSGTLDFPDESQDVVILLAVLTCLVRDEDQDILLKEIRRVLKPEGLFYVNDFLINSDSRNRMRYDQCPEGYPYGVFELPEGALLRHHDEKRIQQLCQSFRQLEYERCVYKTMNGHQSNGFYYLGKK